ncbi:phosphodiester glycosidase family protein [Chitinophagaceae bacterium LB-8]|uniref:Phosphodiester glycosidase family protein n=1 Tax=Paraflavisolibacter caeni TaxID=2982496 RepID=A0A9X2XYY0_9BACT|nr:phosphodiester glycosidase family protein [Paraflavisolibacter caeni]MCU7551412.1 phosphodiester glycosidase family protein [Paraflavisolibacter caeni]
MKNIRQSVTARVMKFIVASFLFVGMTVVSCSAQEKKVSNFEVAEKDGLLKDYSDQSGITLKKLREINPKMKNDTVHAKDTVIISLIEEQPKTAEHLKKVLENVEPDVLDQQLGISGLLKRVVFQGKRYIVCEVNPHQYKIEAFNQMENGRIHNFNSIASLKKNALVFAMNGGMYEPDLSPVGLFVSEGKMYNPVNLQKDGPGNFYMQPNGIFMLDNNDDARILVSDNYPAGNYKPKVATQSGPMIVSNGVFNKAFTKGSPNVNIRNGVGINKANNVVFVISEDRVNFYEFAELFKDKLGCNNALYLDGAISQYYAPELQSIPRQGAPLGTFLTVSNKNVKIVEQAQVPPVYKKPEEKKQEVKKPEENMPEEKKKRKNKSVEA